MLVVSVIEQGQELLVIQVQRPALTLYGVAYLADNPAVIPFMVHKSSTYQKNAKQQCYCNDYFTFFHVMTSLDDKDCDCSCNITPLCNPMETVRVRHTGVVKGSIAECALYLFLFRFSFFVYSLID